MKPTEVTAKTGLLRSSAAALLIGLLLLLVSAPFARMCRIGDLIEGSFVTVVLMLAVLAVGSRRRALIVAIVLVVPAIVGRWVEHYWKGILPAGFVAAAAIVPIAFVVAKLLRFVLVARRVNSEVLCAAVSNYLLLGLLWSFAYVLVERLAPGSFCCGGASSARCRMDLFTLFYFSLMTLCTVGYGDISPVSDMARMLAVLEAIAGAFYYYNAIWAQENSSGVTINPSRNLYHGRR